MAHPVTFWVILRPLWLVLVAVATASFLFSFIRAMLFIHSDEFYIYNMDSVTFTDILSALIIDYGGDLNVIALLFLYLPLCRAYLGPSHPQGIHIQRIVGLFYISLYIGMTVWAFKVDAYVFYPARAIFRSRKLHEDLLTMAIRQIDWNRSYLWMACLAINIVCSRKERALSESAGALLELQKEQEKKTEKQEDLCVYPVDTKVQVEEKQDIIQV